MQLAEFQFLLTPEGQKLLRQTADPPITPGNHLQVASRLRQQIAPALAQAVLETVLLRQLAVQKFSMATEMYFTRPALEQATSETIARYRASRFAQAGFTRLADLGCGIGADALALAAYARVIGIDLDPLRLAMARENVHAYSFGDRFFPVQADLSTLPALDVQAVFFDPARRDHRGRRLHSVALYQPPLQVIDRWLVQAPSAAVKISPAIDYAELPADAEVEFISLGGEVKEGILWYGDLRRGAARSATLLPGGHSLSSADFPGHDVPVTTPETYLYEPDGALIRAHLVQPLARHLGAAQLDPHIAYLTSATYRPTPFARCFALEAWFPFQLKRLRSYLRSNHIGRVTIKKRGSPIEPDALRQQLRLRGDQHRVLFLTHVLGQPAVLIGSEWLSDLTPPKPPTAG